MDDNTVLTTQEVADLLKIAKNTVYELIKRGELNAYRVGKKVRIDRADVEEYKNRTKKIKSNQEPGAIPSRRQNTNTFSATGNFAADTERFHEDTGKSNNFVICGQDIFLDILSRHLQYHPNGVQALRSYVGSYNGLYALYHGQVQMATAHLWDGDTGEYNVPYVKRMLPGISAVIIRLGTRHQGFYVSKGNPKNIHGWEDLLRNDMVMINREKGSGTRILLDEHLKLMGCSGENINGYQRESTSHLAIASTVARGGADIGIGNEKSGLQVNGIDFIPLQTECLDLVIKKDDIEKPPFQAVMEILNSREFKLEIQGIGGYQIEDIGKIIATT